MLLYEDGVLDISFYHLLSPTLHVDLLVFLDDLVRWNYHSSRIRY